MHTFMLKLRHLCWCDYRRRTECAQMLEKWSYTTRACMAHDTLRAIGSVMGKSMSRAAAFWAGCKETRKSSSAGVILLGNHALKEYTRKQNIIAKNCRGRAERSSIGSVAAERSGLRDEASAGHRCKSHQTHSTLTRNWNIDAH